MIGGTLARTLLSCPRRTTRWFIDANSGDTLLGWDTDQFCYDVRKTAMIMHTVLRQVVWHPWFEFRRESTQESTNRGFLYCTIGGMDAYARGLSAAAKIIEDGVLEQMVQDRYSSLTVIWDAS